MSEVNAVMKPSEGMIEFAGRVAALRSTLTSRLGYEPEFGINICYDTSQKIEAQSGEIWGHHFKLNLAQFRDSIDIEFDQLLK